MFEGMIKVMIICYTFRLHLHNICFQVASISLTINKNKKIYGKKKFYKKVDYLVRFPLRSSDTPNYNLFS